MPYDPDWDIEEEGGVDPNPGIWSYENDADEVRVEEVEEDAVQQELQLQDDSHDGHEYDAVDRADSAEGMAVDSHGPDQSRYAEGHTDPTPKSHLPFPGAARLGRLPQMEVVIHSSPRRAAFTAPPNEPAVDSGETSLVTSDIAPRRDNKHQEELAAKAQVVPPKMMQPPVAPPAHSTITPQPKQRGRPFGWRLGHGSYSALRRGSPPGSSTPRPKPKKPAGEQKVRGRPRKNPALTSRQLYLALNPHFLAFRCEWENCPAELQNLETLRKHITMVHGRTPRPTTALSSQPASSTTAAKQPITCKWATCTSGPQPSLESFTVHVETSHLLPYLWHAGDGPRNTTPSASASASASASTFASLRTLASSSSSSSSSTNPKPDRLPAYLFNSRGEQVTPSTHDQQLENEDDRKRRVARINRVLALRDQNAPEEPEYRARDMEIIGEVFSAKQARQRMFGEYADRVRRGGAGMEGWMPG